VESVQGYRHRLGPFGSQRNLHQTLGFGATCSEPRVPSCATVRVK
jgi:hypothetical protein